MTKEEAAAACPKSAEFVAWFRDEFPAGTVVCIQENGHTFGKPPEHWKEGSNEAVSHD